MSKWRSYGNRIKTMRSLNQDMQDAYWRRREGSPIESIHLPCHSQVLYARFTGDMCTRRVLLLYPILSTGQTVLKAISALM